MLLELSEILACPQCGPPQVMVAVVHESVGHRVTRGFLGCPTCDSRFPIDGGAVHLHGHESGAPVVEPAASGVSLAEEPATIIAAVLDLPQGSGHVLLGPGLSAVADAVAALAERWEVVSLGGVRPLPARSTNVSRIVLPEEAPPPVLPGRFGAAALAGNQASGTVVRQFAATLRSMGRLAIVSPGPGAAGAMRDAELEVIAADDRVAVASRRS